MKFVKTFKVRVCLGNGKPVETTIKAASGSEAQDKAKAKYPGALQVHIMGYAAPPEVVIPPKPVVKKTAPPPPVPQESDPNIPFEVQDCLRLHSLGLSHRAIAAQLGIGKTTVGSWLKLYGAEPPSLNENDLHDSNIQSWRSCR